MKRDKEKGKKGKSGTPQYSVRRYVLLGGALGLYFGWFFRPAREPNILIAMGLSVVIAAVLLILPLWRKDRPPMQDLFKQFPINLAQYFLILLVFEARHFAYDWGGRAAVVVLTGLAGCAFGYWMMVRREQWGWM